MRNYLLLLTLISLSGCDFFQSENPQNILLFQKMKADKIVSVEKELTKEIKFIKGKPSKFICPKTTNCKELTECLRTVRTAENELPLITKYYFSKDSMVNFIHYEWSQTVPGLTVKERERRMSIETRRFPVYIAKLNTIAEKLQKEMGEPISNDGEIKKNKTSLLDLYNYNMSFKKGDKYVDLKLIWSPKRGARFFKVWTKVYWIK